MKPYTIFSFYLSLVFVSACQISTNNSTKDETKDHLSTVVNSSKDEINDTTEQDLNSDKEIYGDLPDSVIAELKIMDSLLLETDEEVRRFAEEDAALEALYWKQVATVDTISLSTWNALPARTFKQEQLRFKNVQTVYNSNLKYVQQLLISKGIHSFEIDLYFRAFKEEATLEVWAKSKKEHQYTFIIDYPFYQGISTLGPKKRQGDHQVPEGCYFIDYFNPESTFKISLRLNYPNPADAIRNAKEANMGGAICIHGNEASVGCLAITDLRIPNVYILALEAKDNSLAEVPIHVFPARLTTEKLQELKASYQGNVEYISLWESMEPLYAYFEKKHQLPIVKTTKEGFYEIGKVSK